MSLETIRRVTTIEGNTYDLSNDVLPQLWEATLAIAWLDPRSGISDRSSSPSVKIHVERATLVNAGLLPQAQGDPEPKPEQQETAEDLLLRLLEHVGVFPE